MLEVMLCGASDTRQIRHEFVDVVSQFGGTPLHYLSGDILHLNSTTASWDENSTATVRSADLCVFVIVERYGEIMWTRELYEALDVGKPFLVLCLEETYNKYLTLTSSIADVAAISDPEERALVVALSEIERQFDLTVVQFRYGLFGDVLRRQLARLVERGLELVEKGHQRSALRLLLNDPQKLSPRQLAAAQDLALDEFEDKNIRKAAVVALAARSACDDETILALLRSPEQGVQRLAIHDLPRLYRQRPVDVEFLEEVVSIVNDSDDVGLARRLVPSLFAFSLDTAVFALEGLDLREEGVRRRIAEQLEAHEAEIGPWLSRKALALAERCDAGSAAPGWKERLRALIGRLAAKTSR